MTGKEIRRLRRSLDLTQKQVAEMVGVTHTCISQIESDKRIGKQRTQIETLLRQMQTQAQAA